MVTAQEVGAMPAVQPAGPFGGCLPAMVPQGGSIAARPRREGLYDTEILPFVPIISQLNFFQNTRAFTLDAPTLPPKTFGLDTNMQGPGGSLPRGNYLRVYCAQMYVSARGFAPRKAATIESKRKLWDTGYWTLMLGSTPYMQVPLHRIPSGTGLTGPLSTTEVGVGGLTVGDVQMGMPICTCCFDLTVPGRVRMPCKGGGTKEVSVPRLPIEFAETENFTVSVNWPQPPTMNTDLWITMNLVSIWLKPLAG